MNHQERFKHFKKLIAEGRFEDALNLFTELDLPFLRETELILLLSRWNRNETDKRKGVLSPDEYNLERNRLESAALEIASQIMKSGAEQQPIKPNPDESPLVISNEAELERIIGKNTLTRVEWFAKMVEASKSVCRIVVKKTNEDTWSGTGFLTDGGLLFTNHHVLSGVEDAKYARVEFNYLNEQRQPSIYYLDAQTWKGDESLDFARVKVIDNQDDPLIKRGFLVIEKNATLKSGDPLPILQHPNGEVMQVSIEGNFADRVEDNYVLYTTDTMRGSSGSPVFNNDWKVVALHHASMNNEDLNRGVLFKSILDFLGKNESKVDPPTPIPDPTPPGPDLQNPCKLFWMYDDEEAATYAEKLKTYFAALTKEKKLEIFDMHLDIGTGIKEDVINEKLNSADFIIALVTPMFLVHTIEWADKAFMLSKKIVPVLMEGTPIEGTILSKFATLPTRHKYATAFPSKGETVNAAYLDIYNKIKGYYDNWRNA